MGGLRGSSDESFSAMVGLQLVNHADNLSRVDDYDQQKPYADKMPPPADFKNKSSTVYCTFPVLIIPFSSSQHPDYSTFVVILYHFSAIIAITMKLCPYCA